MSWRCAAIAILAFACVSCNYGGLRSDYAAKDYDPLLTSYARPAVSIIKAADLYIQKHHTIPSDSDLNLQKSLTIDYLPESDSYRIYIKLGWDPSLRYSSKDKSWTFDPGDGRNEKIIRLSP